MKAIIPCAGYGTRVGMNPDRSKELLIDSLTNMPLIDMSLQICDYYGITPFVITRQEKKDLVYYLERSNVEFMFTDPNRKGEWTDSVLQTESHWDKFNLLIFPDTRFRPMSIVDEMRRDLSLGANVSLALHKVTDPEKWCILKNNALHEKPSSPQNQTNHWAFGLIAFQDTYGRQLFKYLNDNKYIELDNASFKYLESFIDLTRGDKK